MKTEVLLYQSQESNQKISVSYVANEYKVKFFSSNVFWEHGGRSTKSED